MAAQFPGAPIQQPQPFPGAGFPPAGPPPGASFGPPPGPPPMAPPTGAGAQPDINALMQQLGLGGPGGGGDMFSPSGGGMGMDQPQSSGGGIFSSILSSITNGGITKYIAYALAGVAAFVGISKLRGKGARESLSALFKPLSGIYNKVFKKGAQGAGGVADEGFKLATTLDDAATQVDDLVKQRDALTRQIRKAAEGEREGLVAQKETIVEQLKQARANKTNLANPQPVADAAANVDEVA